MLAGVGLGDTQNFIVNETTAIRDGAKLLDTRAARRLEGLHDLPLRQLLRDRPAEGVRRRQFRISTRRRCAASSSSATAGSAASTLLDGTIGEGLGEIYVRKHFPPDTKAKMDELVANLRAALKERLAKSAWMDDATRAEALKKLDAFEPRIGYP